MFNVYVPGLAGPGTICPHWSISHVVALLKWEDVILDTGSSFKPVVWKWDKGDFAAWLNRRNELKACKEQGPVDLPRVKSFGCLQVV